MPEERIVFNDPDEARAWDMYVAGALASSKYDTVNNADAMILERRKRMAPPAQIVYSEQFS
jgi:hypothetical protein